MRTWTDNDVQALLDSIVGGELDQQQDRIAAAFKQRKKLLEARVMSAIKPGDRVKFNDKVRPRYMAGQLATVTKVNETTVTVNLDQNAGRFGEGRGLKCPIGLLTVIKEERSGEREADWQATRSAWGLVEDD